MFKTLFKFSAAFLLITFTWVSGSMASGKMEVPLGQQVILEAENLTSGEDYKWVVNKEKEILETQSGSVFTYTFDRQGEYKVNLSATDASGGGLKNTTVSIMVGGRYSKPTSGETGDVFDVPLKASFSTLPKSSEGTLHILGEEGRVVFDFEARSDVLEYRLDRNILVDSDGNGIPNDDVDNAADRSYLLAGIWQTTYDPSDSKEVTAELTVVNTAGKTAKSQVKIVFDDFQPGQGEVVAILDTLPSTDPQDKKIYTYGQEDTVAFYARRSQGGVLEYRIDTNILVDSNADGDPANDIDNQDDDSFKTGDVWTADYKKTDQKIIVQLIVVGEGGVASRIQREIVFKDAPVVSQPVNDSGQTPAISLIADKEFVQKGDPINFTVQGLSQALDSYTFDWDFNGDNKADQSTEGVNTVSYIYDAPGLQKVSVQVKDTDGNQATFDKEIQVKDVQATTANFEYKVEGLTVHFTNLSTASAGLTNQNLTYKWNFGDTDEKNYTAQQEKIGIENPNYTYLSADNYQVTLTVTDSAQVSSKKTIEIPLKTSAAQSEGGDGVEAASGDGSIFGTILKIILYILLAVVVLILLGLVGLLIYLKIKHPDLVFEELIDELKIKILSLVGVHDDLEPEDSSPTPGVTGGVIPPYKPQQQHTPKPVSKVTPVTPVSPVVPKTAPDLTKPNAPMPDWLKPSNETPKAASADPKSPVIEGEIVSSKPVTSPNPSNPIPQKPASSSSANSKSEQNAKDLTKPDGPVPDWLKDA